MITKSQIEAFFNNKKIAMIGVSRNSKKFGHTAFVDLLKKGYDVYPVNPHTDSIAEHQCYTSIDLLPTGIDAAVVITSKKNTKEAVSQLISKGIKNIWIQQSSDTPEALACAEGKDINLIYGKCIFMFSEPTEGMHKFHKGIMRFFGRLPK